MQRIDISRIDLNLLVVFEALIEERHVGRAAARLCLSQSATSHALARLRRLFGDRLFLRHSGGVEPTSHALELARPLAEALARIRLLVGPQTPFDPATLVRTLTIATHDYAIVVLLTKLLARLRLDAPGVDLRCVALSYDELIAGFDRGTVDLACGAMPGFDMRRIARTPLFDDRLVGIARVDHPALRAGRIGLPDFLAYPHVAMGVGGESRSPLDRSLDALGANRRVGMTVPNALSVPSLVAVSDLIGIVPGRLVSHLSAFASVAAFELPLETETMTCDLLMRRVSSDSPEYCWMKALFLRVADEISR